MSHGCRHGRLGHDHHHRARDFARGRLPALGGLRRAITSRRDRRWRDQHRPAAFPFGGVSWTRVGLASNGFLILGGGGAKDGSANQSFPNGASPNAVLAPFWSDLNPEAGGALRTASFTDTLNDWVVFEWDAVSNFSTSGTNSFQVWIGLSGDTSPVEDITFVYANVTAGNGSLLTVERRTGPGRPGRIITTMAPALFPRAEQSCGSPPPCRNPAPTRSPAWPV